MDGSPTDCKRGQREEDTGRSTEEEGRGWRTEGGGQREERHRKEG